MVKMIIKDILNNITSFNISKFYLVNIFYIFIAVNVYVWLSFLTHHLKNTI